MGIGIAKDFETLLKEKGYKLTDQRQIIWNVMLENVDERLSTKKIWEMAKNKDNTIGISTVYRTLQIMDELGIIMSIDKKEEVNKYEIVTDGESCIHPYLICMHCGNIIGIAENLLITNTEVEIHKKYSFEIEDIMVKCYGICEECAKKSIT